MNPCLVPLDSYADFVMLNNRYIDDLGCSPRQAYNAKAHEAVAMNEYELAMRLSPSITRRVSKKGIMHGGVWYSTINAFNHDRVIVRPNINNIKELFVYDESGEFIDIAHCIEGQGVSAEVAKQAEAITMKRIKIAKREMEKSRNIQENNICSIINNIAQNAPKIKPPLIPSINNINIKVAKLHSEARKKVSGDDFIDAIKEIDRLSKEQIDIEKKRDLSFEAAVLGRSKKDV